MSGITTPLTLSSGQTASLSIAFDPTTAVADTGTVTITSNSSSGATATIGLSGTGTSTTAYQVALTWEAPTSSSVPVTGYYVYRALSGSSSYTQLNSSADDSTTYTDSTVQSGSTYNYEVTSVGSAGVQSAPSPVYTATIP
jgi:fibronectin type 3 domain-containing protein